MAGFHGRLLISLPATIKPNQALQKTLSNLFFELLWRFWGRAVFQCGHCGVNFAWSDVFGVWMRRCMVTLPPKQVSLCDNCNFRSHQCQGHVIKHHFASFCHVFFFFRWLVYMQLSTLATSYDDQPSHDQLILSLPFRQSFEKFLDLFSTGVTAVGVLVAARC